MKLLTTIKGTATNGKKARVCIQRLDMAQYGFDIGAPISVSLFSDCIVVGADANADRKVSKVTDKRRGKEYQTIDLRFDVDQREAMFKGAEKLNVWIEEGRMIIRA